MKDREFRAQAEAVKRHIAEVVENFEEVSGVEIHGVTVTKMRFLNKPPEHWVTMHVTDHTGELTIEEI